MFGNSNDNQQQAQPDGGAAPASPLQGSPAPADNPAAPPIGTWPDSLADTSSVSVPSAPIAPQLEPGFEDLAQAAASPVATDNSGPVASDDLLGIKQEALQHLNPLVNHLDQSAEEKFRTTMMMIQASDNQDLIKDAFESAKQITDDKARAQALLDVINEINYFTQQHHQQ